MEKSSQETVRLTLKSHGGKALVMKSRVDKYEGHDVNWFGIGDRENAFAVII